MYFNFIWKLISNIYSNKIIQTLLNSVLFIYLGRFFIANLTRSLGWYNGVIIANNTSPQSSFFSILTSGITPSKGPDSVSFDLLEKNLNSIGLGVGGNESSQFKILGGIISEFLNDHLNITSVSSYLYNGISSTTNIGILDPVSIVKLAAFSALGYVAFKSFSSAVINGFIDTKFFKMYTSMKEFLIENPGLFMFENESGTKGFTATIIPEELNKATPLVQSKYYYILAMEENMKNQAIDIETQNQGNSLLYNVFKKFVDDTYDYWWILIVIGGLIWIYLKIRDNRIKELQLAEAKDNAIISNLSVYIDSKLKLLKIEDPHMLSEIKKEFMLKYLSEKGVKITERVKNLIEKISEVS